MLNRISRIDLDNRVQIYAYFSGLPDFSQRLSNKRFDIALSDTEGASSLTGIFTDDIIVKTLVTSRQEDTDLSLFFRYTPQEVKVSKSEANTLVIDIIPGNRFTGTYQDLSADLGPLFVVERAAAYPVNPADRSEFSQNWPSFFSSLQTFPTITPPLSMLIPPFPWVALVDVENAAHTGYPSALVDSIQGRDWLASLARIQSELKNGPDDSGKKYLAMLHAEILFRLGNIDTAFDQLSLISDTYGSEPIGLVARYLGFLLDAGRGRYHLAQAGIKRLSLQVPAGRPLVSYLRLSLLETGLALQQADHADLLARTVPAADEAMKQRLLIRTADTYRAQGLYAEALEQYAAFGQSLDLRQLPYALNGYCAALWENRRYQGSFRCFQDLAELLQEDEQKSAALYMAAMASYRDTSYRQTDEILQRIIDRFPATEAARRAQLKQIDRCVAADARCYKQGIQGYEAVSETVTSRELRSEAWFKKAVLLHLSGADQACVNELMNWLRTFQSGNLRVHALALLIQLLPDVIDQQLTRGNDMEAVILAQQTRPFFEKRWIDFSVLRRLIPALERMGLFREAIELLLFLRNQNERADQQEMLATLTRLAYLLGDTYLVEDFSSQYFYRFPDGQFTDDIRFYRIDSTYASGRIDEAAALLPTPLPERTDFRFLAASISFQQNGFSRTADILMPMNKGLFSDSQLFMLAESLHKLGRSGEAVIYFSLLEDVPQYREIALYRTARNNRDGTLTGTGTNQMKKIAASSGDADAQWRRFAAQRLRYEKMMETL